MSQRSLSSACIPESRVCTALVSYSKRYIIDELERIGIRTVPSGSLTGISGAERLHADMGFCHIGAGHIFAACNSDEKSRRQLSAAGLTVHLTAAPVSAASPSLNLRILSDKLLCCTRTADSELIDLFRAKGFGILHTNQRYTACSTAIVAENALITADESIYRLCLSSGIDALKISEGHIDLEGYSHGFIGGCCGLISKDTLAFSGDISMHPDYPDMKAFAASYGVSLLSLSDSPLYDIGGILPLTEERR